MWLLRLRGIVAKAALSSMGDGFVCGEMEGMLWLGSAKTEWRSMAVLGRWETFD
jgi:hypothetical protein